MRSWSAKPEGARARRRRLNRGNGKKLALMSVIATTSMAMILTPPVANAASSQTYFVGVPDWLPIGEGSKLPNDPVAINNAMVAAKDRNPLIGWGRGGVDLRPTWVKWYTPVNPADPTDRGQDQYYTPGKFGIVGYETISYTGPNPAYQPTYDKAYELAYNRDAAYAVVYARISKETYDKEYAKRSKGCSGWTKKACEAVAAAEATVEAKKVADRDAPAAAIAEAQKIAREAAELAVKYLPKEIDFSEQIPIPGWEEDGYWTTTTSGQWVTPDQVADLPTAAQLAFLARALESGDMSALAPVLNWTAYLSNVNLIAYGDGAIAAGAAYQAFIDSANGETHEGYNPFAVGDPQTGPRKIKITFDDGVVTVADQTHTTNNPLEIPLPGDLEFPDAPQVGWETVQEGGVIDVTLLSLLLVRNPGRPNGGLYSRFAPIYEELTGVNPVTPDRQDVLPEGFDPELITKLLTGNARDISFDELGNLQGVIDSVDGQPIIVTVKADVGWEYDLLSDAPATANPIAWANSLASAVLLTNLLTGVDFGNLGAGGYIGPDGTVYYTLPVEQLPLLALPRLASAAIGLATGEDVNTPLADALEPVLKMLVNIGYNDVVRNADGTYTRTLDRFGEPTLFGTPTLTPAQMALLPGDFVRLLGAGVGDEMTDVLTRAVTRIVERANVGLTAEQRTQLNSVLATPGKIMKTVSEQVGQQVSTAATAVERQTPDLSSPSQAELGAQQRQVGQGLATVRDGVNEAVDGVKSAADNLKRSGAGSTASPDKVAVANSAADGGANKATPESRYGGTRKDNGDGGANKFTPGTIARVPGSSAANADNDADTGAAGDSNDDSDSKGDGGGEA